MEKIQKYILSFVFLCVFCIGFTSIVYGGEQGECNAYLTYSPEKYVNVVIKKFPKLSVYTEQDLKTALRHIQQFCCYGWISLASEKICKERNILESPRHYGYSPFMIDHLWNVGMRKLDGIEDHCKTLDISCIGEDGSRVALERRKKIEEIAEDIDGHPPSEIMELFIETWWDPKTLNEDKKKHRKDHRYEKLRNIYSRMCLESEDIWDYITSLALANGAFWHDNIPWGVAKVCRDMVQERYLQEVNYVRTLMVEHGTQYVMNNLRDYQLKYFIQNRFSQLLQKYAQLEWCFVTVLKKTVPTACCNN